MITVKKWDKTREPYDPEKVRRTLYRYGFNKQESDEILQKIENRLYDGIPTKKILSFIDEEIEQNQYRVQKSDLRTALAAMKSAPDFEIFVHRLFSGLGYKVTPNRVIQGHCVTHEIDGVAEKDGKKYYIETKHHSNIHNRTPFIDSLAVKAKMDDIRHGYVDGKNDYDFDGSILICNTKMTSHAEAYSRCVGIRHIGWNMPRGEGIEEMIETSKVYPFTILPGLNKNEIRSLRRSGVVTLEDVLNIQKSRINSQRINEFKEKARQILR